MSMRILVAVIVAVSAVGVVHAQSKSKPAAPAAKAADKKGPNADEKAKGSKPGELSPVETAELAAKLVDWARKNGNASAMAVAAQMLDSVPVQQTKKQKETESGKTVAAKATKATRAPEETDAKALKAEAIKMAGDNDQLVAAIETINKSTPPKARGRTQGPAQHCDTVMSEDVDMYRMTFNGREVAEVGVIGDGDTDLDLVVFDEHGNKIEADTDDTDECYVRWVPAYTGEFVIAIKNYGNVYNQYCLLTN